MRYGSAFRIALLVVVASATARSIAQGGKPTITGVAEQQDQPLQLTVTMKNVKTTDVTTFLLFTSIGAVQLDGQHQLKLEATDVTAEYVQGIKVDPATFGTDVVYVVLLKQPLARLSYVVAAVLDAGESPTATISPAITAAKRGDATGRYELVLKSATSLGLVVGQKITLSRTEQVAGTDKPQDKAYPGDVTAIAPERVSLRLDHKLPAGQKSQLALTSPMLGSIGSVDLAGVPQNESDASILVKANAVVAVHQAPVFTLSGSAAPWHPAVKSLWLGSTRFDPSVVFDVGLRSTKTQNSITVPAPLSITQYYRYAADPSAAPTEDQHSSKPVGFMFSFGPRYETDRTFQRVNVLGELRTDLYLPGLLHGATAVKARTLTKLPQFKNLLIAPTHGFEFVPYLELDGGGHVRTESVINSKAKVSEIVAQYPIARFTFGVTAKIDFTSWFHLSADISAYELFQPEQVGFTTVSGVGRRTLSGIHPHLKPDFTLNLDQAHHWAIDVTWENGRSAPNFEYLNTVNSGIKIIY